MQEDLFIKNNSHNFYNYSLYGSLDYYSDFISQNKSKIYFDQLLKKVPWQQDQIKIMGKDINIPRLTCWFGTESYTYSGIKMSPYPLNNELKAIKTKLEKLTSCEFNSVLMNLYRNGDDSVDWHSDDEKEIDPNSKIASISLGANRDFQYKSIKNNDLKLQNLLLPSGSLLIMNPPFQQNFIHRVPKRKKVTSSRINLTFRVIKTHGI